MDPTATETQKAQMTVTLNIDGQNVTVTKGATVLDACKQANIPVPTFCWHPKLKSVGACRICYVEIEKFPKLMVSCATEAMEGMLVQTNSEKCREGRKAVVELTLLDHPLDCPTCDKGGECDLQDISFDYGLSDQSQYAFNKFRFNTDTDKNSTFDDLTIGPEMVRNQNRCILCYKCTRANEEAFGEHDIGVYYRGNVAEINAAPGGQVESLYSGNLVEICPVGALTSSDWRYQIRVWNTRTVPSIDPFHADGANITLWKDAKKVYRATSRRNDDVDEGWISDISRYGYQIATSEKRLRTPLIKRDGSMVEASWDEALELIAKRIGGIKNKYGAPTLAGVISPNLDLATLHAFGKFFRGALGTNNIDYRSSYAHLPEDPHSTFTYMSSRPFNIANLLKSNAILVVGSNLIREHPNVHLRVRKAVTECGARLYTANPYETKSGDCSADEMVVRPGSEEAFLNGLALSLISQGLAKENVDVSKIDTLLIPNSVEACAEVCGISSNRLNTCAAALARSTAPSILAGEIISNSIDREKIANALFNLSVLLGIESEGRGQAAILAKAANSKGAEALGLCPEISAATTDSLSAIVGALPELPGANWDKILDGAVAEEIKALMIFGASPLQTGVDYERIKKSLDSLEFLVVADLFETQTSAMADVVLPISSFAEYSGLYVNLEGRVQETSPAMRPAGSSLPGYEALNLIAQKFDYSLYLDGPALLTEASEIIEKYPPEKRKPLLMESHHAAVEPPSQDALPLYVGDALHHFGHWTEQSQSLLAFDSGPRIELSASLAKRLGIADGEKVRITGAPGEKIIMAASISQVLKGNVVYATLNFSQTQVNCLLDHTRRVNFVTLKKTEKS